MSNPAFEVEDFSGGMTDFFLQGDKKRYQYADNFLIDEDRKLFVRDGSDGFDYAGNHRLPEPIRIGAFLRFDQNRELILQQARKLFYLGTNWTEVVGPEGAPAIGGGSAYDAISWAEWKGHTYFASAGGGLPGKLYRNPEGEFQVRTAGLPLPASKPRYSKDGLLAACLTLANDLRAQMIAHMSSTSLHNSADKYSLSYFATQSFNFLDPDVPSPIPTPAPAATDEDSLFALVLALNSAYEYHGKDAGEILWHSEIQVTDGAGNLVTPPKGPYKRLTDNAIPDSVERAAGQLDELRQRWNWHRLGLYTHSTTNDYDTINVFPVTAPPIGNTDTEGFPQVSENVADVIRYANYLKNAYNLHVSNGVVGADWNSSLSSASYPHSQLQLSNYNQLCVVPDAVDLDSAYLIIYQVWVLYGAMHFSDANAPAHKNITFDAVGGTADITDVKDEAAAAVTLSVGSWVITQPGVNIFTDSEPLNKNAAKVVASASGTATLSKVVAASADQAAQASASAYHGAYTNGTFTTTTVTQASTDETPDPRPGSGLTKNNLLLPASLKEWVSLAQTTFQMLSFHMSNSDSHQTALPISNHLSGNGQFYLPEVGSYAYAFVWKYTYKTQNGVEFLVEGPPTFVGPIETAKPRALNTILDTGFAEADTSTIDAIENNAVLSVASASITNLPRLQNNANTNYDVTNIKLEIFRTQDGGNTYYLLDEVDNGVASYTDTASDTESTGDSAILSDRSPLYTTGGEVAHDPAPDARFMHIFQDTAYYGYITDTGQIFKDRILQSIPGALEAVPATFFDDLGDELMGITSTRSNVLALCRSSLYRMQGGYNNLGQGVLTHERISNEMGCVSSKSIVQTEVGVFFAGTDGFYYTDGFQLIKISIDLNKTYRALTKTDAQAAKIHGTYDKRTRRIWWSVASESSSLDCDKTFVFYLDYGIKPSGVFTTISNGSHWAPSAITFFNDDMIRGDRRGLLFRHNDRYKSDPKIPTDSAQFDALDQWGKVHVPYLYRSCALDFGTIDKGSYVTKIHLLGANKGNAAVQISSISDNNNFARSKKDVAPIRFRDNLVWGDPRVVWGDPDSEWKTDGRLDHSRHFPSGNLRAQLKQIEIRPAYTGVYKYDEYPEGSFCDVSLSELKATIATPADFTDIKWPQDVVGMVIAFADDNYVAEYPITQWFYNEILFTNPEGALIADLVNQEWVIRGYQKEASFHMLAYSMNVAIFGERGNTAIGNGGENA